MSDRQAMNAVDPSHRRSGIRRTSALAGFTLLATTGAFGAYLGNPRLQRSYAAATCNVATESELNAALASFTANPSTDCTAITLTKLVSLNMATKSFVIGPSAVRNACGKMTRRNAVVSSIPSDRAASHCPRVTD